VRRVTHRLTRSVEATVFSGESESGRPPKVVAVVIRPRVGSGGDVSVFAVQQLTAEMLRSDTIRDAKRDESEFHLITDADPWAKLRAELLDAAAIFPDYAPSEFDTDHAAQLLDQLTATLDKLRDEIHEIHDRLSSIDSEEQLAYVETDTNSTPTRPPVDLDRLRRTLQRNRHSTVDRDPETRHVSPESKLVSWGSHLGDLKTENLILNRRTGLWVDTTQNRKIVALPSQDGVVPSLDPRLLLFDVTHLQNRKSGAPDLTIRKQDGSRLDIYVKRWSVLRDTQAMRPRQISAAIAALEARQKGEHVAGRYAVTAKTLGIPPERPIIVQRLIASVMKLIANPETEMLVRFLAPKEVNIDKVIEQVQDGGAPLTDKKKSRKKRT